MNQVWVRPIMPAALQKRLVRVALIIHPAPGETRNFFGQQILAIRHADAIQNDFCPAIVARFFLANHSENNRQFPFDLFPLKR